MTSADPAKPEPTGRISQLLAHPAVKIVVPLLIVGITLFVLHDLSAKVRWSDVKTDLAASSWRSILLAVSATAVSFFALSFYDVLAVRSVATGQVPDRMAAFAGGAGTAVSNLLGFPI